MTETGLRPFNGLNVLTKHADRPEQLRNLSPISEKLIPHENQTEQPDTLRALFDSTTMQKTEYLR